MCIRDRDGSKWVTDDVTSPCIDAGDPASDYANEPAPNGGRINLGCYGNTAEASKSGTSSASYWVTFNKNGGDTEANPSTKEVISGGNVGRLPAPPTRSGYTFNGWNTQADGRGTVFTAMTPVTAPITVYAQWSRDSLDESDDSFVDSGGTSTTSEGNIVTVITTVTAALDGSKKADVYKRQIFCGDSIYFCAWYCWKTCNMRSTYGNKSVLLRSCRKR